MSADFKNITTKKDKVDIERIDIEIGSDIEIGAVELKNATTDDRCIITAANTARAAADMVLTVQHLGPGGVPLPVAATDDDSVPAGSSDQLVLSKLMGYDGAAWERLQTDGNGALDVNVAEIATEDDDDSIAGGNTHAVVVPLLYGYDGANWERLVTDGSGSLTMVEDNSAAILADTNAMVVDLAAIEVLLTGIDSDTDAIKTATELLDNVVGVEGAGMVTSGNALILDDGANAVLAQANGAGDLKVTLDGEVVNVLLANTNDDDSVPYASNDTLVISKMYGSDGVSWERLATDGTGTLTVVEDNSAAILADTNAMVVDLAAIEVLLTGIDSDTDAIKTAVELIDNAIAGSEMQVDVVAALPAGANLIGSVTALGSAAEDAAASGNPVLSGGRYDLVARSLDSGDVGAIALSSAGRVLTEDSSFDSGTSSNKTFEVNPLSEHHVEETLASLTNITTNTTAYLYFDMDGFRHFSLQGVTSGPAPTDTLTVTVEVTNQDDGTAAASCNYIDVTNALFGVGSWVDTDFFAIHSNPVPCKYVRVKYVTSNGGGNDADLTVYLKKMW